MNKLHLFPLLIKEIGIPQLTQYAVYFIGMRSGYYRHITPAGGWKSGLNRISEVEKNIPFEIPSTFLNTTEEIDKIAALDAAETILAGEYFPFSAERAVRSFSIPDHPIRHWTRYHSTVGGMDIKLTWEPARFSWVFPLIQAFAITRDERYAECFWKELDRFQLLNPVNMGPAWSSGQEVALRTIPWVWALKAFSSSKSTTPERITQLCEILENSAKRILPTLSYARSQNNNHLLSEAVGLIVIGKTLQECHSSAQKWLQIGFSEFEYGILTQVDDIGNYSQQSANYHRLMLQLALIYSVYAQSCNHKIPSEIKQKISQSTHYLCSWIDQSSGMLPNFGHNDGTLLLPFGVENYRDYRPTLQAASLSFLDVPAFPPGKWDALSFWLGLAQTQRSLSQVNSPLPSVLRVGDMQHWACLRAVQYHSRPAHADQLTVDLWWNGLNIALDAGTYMYNAPSPWENAFTTTGVHNTVMVDGCDQMLRAGKFLLLDRLNAKPVLTSRSKDRVAAEIIPNKRISCRQKRTLEWNPPYLFTITDELIPPGKENRAHRYSLQWLLPDWKWKFLPEGIQLQHEDTIVQLKILCQEITSGQNLQPEISLIRAGETLFGEKKDPIRGWVSPTYSLKQPALSISFTITSHLPVCLTSIWDFSLSPNKSG